MVITGAIFESAISGIVPGIGVVVGGAIVKIMTDRRKAKAHLNSNLEERVAELTEVLGGTEKTRFQDAKPGIVKRFDVLEEKVDGHGRILQKIEGKIDKLATGQAAAADIAKHSASRTFKAEITPEGDAIQ